MLHCQYAVNDTAYIVEDKPMDDETAHGQRSRNGGKGASLTQLPVMHAIDAQTQVFNKVVGLSSEIVDELMAILRYRDRGVNLAASVRAGEMLLAVLGIGLGGEGAKAGGSPAGMVVNQHGSGPVQVNAEGQGGPDRLTQELIDIVKAGNRASGNGRK